LSYFVGQKSLLGIKAKLPWRHRHVVSSSRKETWCWCESIDW